jgi:hypothetical protein
MDAEAVKVALTGPDGEVETLWANPVGPGQYALDNLPWYAYGVSLGDIVEADADASGGGRVLAFRRVVRKSGNRTVRVILEVREPGGDAWTFESERLLARLAELGCGYEGYNRRLVALNVPPASDLAAVAAALTEAGFEWEYADPTYEEVRAADRDAGGHHDA